MFENFSWIFRVLGESVVMDVGSYDSDWEFIVGGIGMVRGGGAWHV